MGDGTSILVSPLLHILGTLSHVTLRSTPMILFYAFFNIKIIHILTPQNYSCCCIHKYKCVISFKLFLYRLNDVNYS